MTSPLERGETYRQYSLSISSLFSMKVLATWLGFSVEREAVSSWCKRTSLWKETMRSMLPKMRSALWAMLEWLEVILSL